MKKIIALLIAMMLVLSMGVAAFAEEPTSGTITLKNATKGYEYKAYKILDATYTTTTAEDPETGTETTKTLASYTTKTPDLFKGEGSIWVVSDIADANGNYNVQLADGKTAEDVSTWVESNLASFTAITPTTGVDANGLAEEAQVVWSNLDFGYYYITSGLGTTVTIDSAVPEQEVYDKNETEPEDPEKTIIAVDGVEKEELTEADAHVGSVVKFQVVAKTNNWIDKDTIREKWEITDTPTNMEIDLDSVVVKFNDTELDKDTDYTASLDSGTLTINVPMVDAEGNSIFPANTLDEGNTIYGLIPIEITYEATITKAAADASAKNEIPDIPGPPVIINTYAVKIVKVDQDNQPLKGAEFQLWSAKGGEGEGAALTFIDNGDGTYTFSEDTAETLVTTLSINTDIATIVVKGLDTGWDYVLKEITVPEGYNQAPDKDISGENDLTLVKTVEIDSEGNVTEVEIDTTIQSTDLNDVTVENKAGTVLPSTGGIGTTIFYIAGSILVLAAAVLLITKRRMGHND